MVLGRSEILNLVEAGVIRDCSMECVGGAGYDLRIDRIYRLNSNSLIGANQRKTPEVEEVEFESYTLAPAEYVLVETLEKVDMPGDLVARVLNRSSVFRCGCSLFTALVDPGYQGTLTFGLKNLSARKFTLERGSRIAQLVFEKVAGDTIQYRGKYQGGKIV